jgi:hypothetical protein
MKTLFEILPDFLNGKKIRRVSWNQNLWLETTDGTLTRLMIKEDSGIRLLHIGEGFSLDDVKAKDWEIVQ